MRILVLASDNPNPPINGTRIRNYYLWPIFRKMGHEVKVLAITRNPEDKKHSNDEIEFLTFTRKSLIKRIWMRLFHSYHEWPVSDELSRRVDELKSSWKPDIIHAEELRMGRYLPEDDHKILKSVCAHNVETDLIKKTKAAPFKYGINFFNRIYEINLKRFEKKIFAKADIRLTYSQIDQGRYRELYPKCTFFASSNGVNLIHAGPEELKLPSPANILFLGSLSYLPNIEGLFWFIDEIMPQLKISVTLTVAGSTPTSEVKNKLIEKKITLLDTPLDLRPVYFNNSLLIVPLLSGSGTRGKILESLMYGRPVLTTPKGVEGLELSEREGILLAKDVNEFAAKLDHWQGMGPYEREQLSSSGRSAVIKTYTWDRVAENLLATWKA